MNEKKLIEEYILSSKNKNSLSFLSGLFNFLEKNSIIIEFNTYDLLLKEFNQITDVCKSIIGNINKINESMLRSYSRNNHVFKLLYLFCEINNIEIIEENVKIDSAYSNNYISNVKNLDLRVLTKEEVKDLFIKYKNGDIKARNKIIESNLRLVMKIAKKYSKGELNLDYMDVISAGNEGLIRAIESFDPNLGYTFSTYATWWIDQSITRFITNELRTIRLPVHLYEDILKIKKSKVYLFSLYNREPTIEEISENTGLSIKRITNAEQNNYSIKSLDEPLNNEEEYNYAYILEDKNAINAEEFIVQEDNKKYLLGLIENLNERDQMIFKLRFGFVDGTCWTLQSIGDKFGLTREGVRLREKTGLQKLKKLIEIDRKKQTRK